MIGAENRHDVEAWSFGDAVVLESYRYVPGPAARLPEHAHDEYQLCLSLNFPGVYRYRGASHDVPIGSLSVIHPGEVHSAHDPMERRVRAEYRMMYVGPSLLANLAAQITGRATQPFFPKPVLLDTGLARRFGLLHASLGGETSRLEQDSRLLSTLASLVLRHADTRPSPKLAGKERRAVRLVREYLDANLAENVSLDELTSLAHMSPFHLSRVFKAEVGIPPHAYHTQARLDRAKGLLLEGWSITHAALETGFADQSHFTRRFKRLVGVTPGVYARNSKNVQ